MRRKSGPPGPPSEVSYCQLPPSGLRDLLAPSDVQCGFFHTDTAGTMCSFLCGLPPFLGQKLVEAACEDCLWAPALSLGPRNPPSRQHHAIWSTQLPGSPALGWCESRSRVARRCPAAGRATGPGPRPSLGNPATAAGSRPDLGGAHSPVVALAEGQPWPSPLTALGSPVAIVFVLLRTLYLPTCRPVPSGSCFLSHSRPLPPSLCLLLRGRGPFYQSYFGPLHFYTHV